MSIKLKITLGLMIASFLLASSPLKSRSADKPGIISKGVDEPVTPDRSEQSWSTLKGRFLFDGIPPEMREMETYGADIGSHKKHPVQDESLVVHLATGGIKGIVLYARKVSRVHKSHERLAKIPVIVEQKNCAFVPHVFAIRVGQPLTIANGDSIVHTCVCRPRRGMEVSKELNVMLFPGDQLDFCFPYDERQPIPLTCSFHPWMKAYVLVRANSYFAVTDENGSFEIPNLPAGEEIEFQVWHERAGGTGGPLVANVHWLQGRFQTTIPPGTVKNLGDIQVPASAFDRLAPARKLAVR